MLSRLFGKKKPAAPAAPAKPATTFYDRLMTEPLMLRFMIGDTEIHRQPILHKDVIRYPNGMISISNSEGFTVANNTDNTGTLECEFWVGSECLSRYPTPAMLKMYEGVEMPPGSNMIQSPEDVK